MRARSMAAGAVAIRGAGILVVAAFGAGGGLPKSSERVVLKPADFTTKIDNPYWPMKPGTRWVYRETDPEGTSCGSSSASRTR